MATIAPYGIAKLSVMGAIEKGNDNWPPRCNQHGYTGCGSVCINHPLSYDEGLFRDPSNFDRNTRNPNKNEYAEKA
jgi:hypothetical protein